MPAPLKTTAIAQVELDRLSEIEKLYNRIRRKQTLREIIGHELLRAVREDLPRLVIPPYQASEYDPGLDEEELVLLISDCQVGSKGDAHGTGGLATYSYSVFLERLARYQNAVDNIIRYHPNRMKVLNIWFLGDIIDGSTIFESQGRQIETGAVQQAVFAVEHLAAMINRLSEGFEEVRCVGVVGNHGRIGKKGVGSIMDNLEYVIYLWLKERLASNPRVSWTVPESYWVIVERAGFKHLLVHGDRGIYSSFSIPYYGIGRFKAKMADLLTKTFAIDRPFDYIHMGHFSRSAHFDDVFMNGSWDAGTEFSIVNMTQGGRAEQWALALHKHWGVSWSREINLNDPRKKPKLPVVR